MRRAMSCAYGAGIPIVGSDLTECSRAPAKTQAGSPFCPKRRVSPSISFALLFACQLQPLSFHGGCRAG